MYATETNPKFNSIKKGNIKIHQQPRPWTVFPSPVSHMPLFSSAQLILKTIKEKKNGLEALKPEQSMTTSSSTGLLALDGMRE